MTIILMQLAALALVAWLLRGSGNEAPSRELPQPAEFIDPKER